MQHKCIRRVAGGRCCGRYFPGAAAPVVGAVEIREVAAVAPLFVAELVGLQAVAPAASPVVKPSAGCRP
ncbi:hypothetical protein GZL_04512 [Streptomyces sp. 769]|nr:hypothetical protein GZL_04512 [Streptomyces sp. 769]